MDFLEERFRAANLACAVTNEPIERARDRAGTVAVVQMDIARTRRGDEEFRIYRGAPSNRVEVTSFDRRERQLLLMVHEPRRRFEATVSKFQPVPPNVRVVYEDKRVRVIEQLTTERKRHFLCGMDESHLFIAQLPRAAANVAAAHRVLRPVASDARVKRQGEWFFMAPDASVLARDLIDAKVIRRRTGIAQAAGLARAGRPHVADEVFAVGARIYVRGAIRHPDHKTVRFSQWTNAVPNTEAFEQPAGVKWID